MPIFNKIGINIEDYRGQKLLLLEISPLKAEEITFKFVSSFLDLIRIALYLNF